MKIIDFHKIKRIIALKSIINDINHEIFMQNWILIRKKVFVIVYSKLDKIRSNSKRRYFAL